MTGHIICITRRPLSLALVFMAGALRLTSSLGAEERPNILMLFADDWGRHASIYAQMTPGGVNDVVETPVFDRMARKGVLFRHAHVSSPSCTPSRSALLTGQHFWRTEGGAVLRGTYPEHLPSYPVLLREAGYHLGYTYKVWLPGTPKNAPFLDEERYESAGAHFNRFSFRVNAAVKNGASLEEAKKVLYDEVRANFREFLKAQEAGQPFCYWFGPTNVHRKWMKGSAKKQWGLDPELLKGKMPPFLPDVPEVREDLADYMGEIFAWDAALGVILEELERSGQMDKTLIIISGDHGAPGFPYGKCNLYDFGTGVPLAVIGPGVKGGRVVNDMVSLTDLAPTILEAANIDVPSVMTGRSLWNVLKSSEAGLVDTKRTRIISGRERHVPAARADGAPYPQRCIRTHDHALIINFRPDRWPLGDPYVIQDGGNLSQQDLEQNIFVTLADEDAGPTKAWIVSNRNNERGKRYFERAYGKRPKYELYDLNKDPHEIHNVAEDPAYAVIFEKLKAELLAELASTADPRLIDDGRFFETPPMGGTAP